MILAIRDRSVKIDCNLFTTLTLFTTKAYQNISLAVIYYLSSLNLPLGTVQGPLSFRGPPANV